jgi:hypothetical protein
MSAMGSSRSDGDVQDKLVPAVFARSAEEAEVYRQLLDDHDIPAVVAADDDVEHPGEGVPEMTHGVPIMVPEPMLDEAGEVIAHRQDLKPFQSDDETDEYDDDDDDDDDDGFGADAQIDGEFDDSFDDEEDDLLVDDSDDDADELDDLGEDDLP